MSFKRNSKPSSAKQRIRYPTIRSLTRINREAVALTKDKHHYTELDEQRLRRILTDVRKTANKEEPKELIIQKASLFIYRIASGQHFHEGNKRTALLSAEAFLKFNGYTIDIADKTLLDLLHKVSIGQAGLSSVRDIVRQLIRSV